MKLTKFHYESLKNVKYLVSLATLKMVAQPHYFFLAVSQRAVI